MKQGIAIPISATRHLPGWALGLSLATHLVLLFGPALQRPTAAVDLPALAVSFRLPTVLAPAVAASTPLVAPAVPAAPAAALRSAPTPPVRTALLAVAAAGSTGAPAVTVVPAVAPSSPSAEPATPVRAAEPPAAAATPDPEAMARYVRLLGDLLAQQQQYPRLAAARGWEGEVRLRLLVARKGTVLAVHIVHSSGFDVLDQHAVQLVQGTLLPPPPQQPNATANAGGPDLTIDIPIHYALKRS